MKKPSKKINVEFLAGKVVNYYNKIRVASVEISDYLKVGHQVRIKGQTSGFEQTIGSIQIKHQQAVKALNGQVAGISVKDYHG